MKTRVPNFVCLLALIALFACFAAGQSRRTQPKPSPTPPDEDSVKIETEEVKVNLVAFDETGNFFPGVTVNDVVVSENNILHQPEMIRRVRANVLIVMDTGGEMRVVKTLDQTRKVAHALVGDLRDEDRVAILQYADRAVIASAWSTDKEQISDAIGKTKFGLRSAFVDAINLAREYLDTGDLDNKHLVLITDGTDSSADLSKKNAAMRRLLSTDIAVHVISYAQLEAVDIEPRTKMISKTPPPQAMPDEIKAQLPNGVRDLAQAPRIGPTINLDRALLKKMKERKADLEVSEEMLESLVENTNGTIIVPATLDEMVEKAATVAKMIDSSYVLTYIPKVPFAEKGGVRNIEVTSKRSGLIVQAKRKFIVPPRK